MSEQDQSPNEKNMGEMNQPMSYALQTEE